MLVGNNKRTECVDPMPIEDNIEDEDDDDDDRGDPDDESRTSLLSESPLKKKRRHNKEQENENEDEKERGYDMDNKNADTAAASTFVTAAFPVEREDNNDHDKGETDDENDDVSTIQAQTKKTTNKKKRILVPWDDMFERLTAYQKKHNTAHVPSGYSTVDKKLAKWVTTQRTSYKNKELSIDQINRLELIGFVWKFVNQNTWEESFQQLVAHYKSQPPQQYKSMNVKAKTALGSWVKYQRKSYEKETLSIERIYRLEAIGFVWVVETLDYDEMWIAMFEKYLVYQKETNSSSVVPKKADPSLANWMMSQRSYYKHKHQRLSVDRINRLHSAGFVWDLQQQKRQQKKESKSDAGMRWDTVFQQLITYKDEHKGCVNVSKRGADAKLGRWVVTQRQKYRKEKLSPDRITRLESIGFVWDFKDQIDQNWMEMYQKLLIYKQEHKDCIVPQKYHKDLKLGGWVKSKRFYYNYNNTGTYKLSPKHLQLLNAINFFGI